MVDNSTPSCVTSHSLLRNEVQAPIDDLRFDVRHLTPGTVPTRNGGGAVKITGATFFSLSLGSIRAYSRITSTKSPSFRTTTFSASLTNLTALLPQPLRKQTNTDTSTALTAETR